MKYFQSGLFLLLICAISTSYGQGNADEGLGNFVIDMMSQGFVDWINSNGYDPTEPTSFALPVQLDSSLYNLQGYLTNVEIRGLSTSRDYYSYGSFNEFRVNLEMRLSPFTFSGRYNLTGNVLGSIPLIGADQFNISGSGLSIYFETQFHIESGYIKLNRTDAPWSNWFSLYGYSMEFTNLFSNETEPFKNEIFSDFAENLDNIFYNGGNLPFYDFIFAFLQTKFQSTPVTEIINWPRPTEAPPTTETAYPTYETDWPWTTTTNPCIKREPKSASFNAFLRQKLRGFIDWIHEQGLDPTPPNTESISIQADSSFLKLNASYWNTTLYRFTNENYWSVQSDLFESNFRVEIQLQGLGLKGVHESFGSIISTYPLNGTGEWIYDTVDINADFYIGGFGVVNGYVTIDEYDYRYVDVRVYNSDSVRMPGFLEPEDADGLGRTVLEELGPRILGTLQDQRKFPLEPVLLDYLRKVFEETSLAEILNTPPGPCVV